MKQDLFQAPDYYNLDDLLTEEHKLVRNAAREWVKRAVSPIIEEYAQKAEFPTQIINGLAAIGAAMDCYDTALRYCKERKQFNKPIGLFQLQQKKLAEMITEITKAQLLAWRLGTLKNEGKATSLKFLWQNATM